MKDSDHITHGSTRQHVTDGDPCWCNPKVEKVEPHQVTYLDPVDPVLINVSGIEDEPLWVDPYEVAAIGVRGKDSTLLVLKGSGTQLVAKSTHPNEVAQAVCGVPGLGNEPTPRSWIHGGEG